MKRLLHILPVISLSALFSMPSYGQPWSGILASSRAIDWSQAGLPATLPDGETTVNPWTPPPRTQYGSTITPSGSAATDLSNINAALSACTNGHYVLLGTGTFQIQGTIAMYNMQSCTLRGSGPQRTTLALNSSGRIATSVSTGGGMVLTISPAAGATSVVGNILAGAAPQVGDILTLNQCDTGFSGVPYSLGCNTGSAVDNGGLWVCSNDPACSLTASGSHYGQFQTFRITAVSNAAGTYTIGLNNPILMSNWSTARSADAQWHSVGAEAAGVGLEDITITEGLTTPLVASAGISMDHTFASWLKGVRIIGAGVYFPLAISASVNSLIANNYIFSGYPLTSAFPAAMEQESSSHTMLLNNISASGVPWEGFGGNSGNVIAYNYGRDQGTGYTENIFFDHHAYSSFNLFEGNKVAGFDEDYILGTHDLNTYFRNYAVCWDEPYTTYSSGMNARGLQVGPYHRFENYVANATGSQCSSYQGTGYGNAWLIDTSDPLVASTMMRWGNVSIIAQSSDTPSNSGIRFASSEVPSSLAAPNTSFSNPVPSGTSLPASFFMGIAAHPNGGTGLSWWNVCTNYPTCSTAQTNPFPFVGPDVSGGPNVKGRSYDPPSYVAWNSLPIDTTYQASYSISSSSWSGGIETLTVSSLPNVEHMMGGFQLSGADPACLPSSGVSYTGRSDGEILITGSTSTTVSYALPSSPGVSCTGTFKFPNIRQFDGRVYQTDPKSSPVPAPPTSLSATVK